MDFLLTLAEGLNAIRLFMFFFSPWSRCAPRLFGVSLRVTLLAIYFFCLAPLVLASQESSEDTRPRIIFTCEAGLERSVGGITQRYLSAIFDELGYRYIQKYANIDHAIELLKSGQVDGDCARLDGFVEISGLEGYKPIGPAYSHVVLSRWYLKPPLVPRSEQRVGYNANVLVLKHHLMNMGYEKLYPFYSAKDSIERLRRDEWDLIVNYSRDMSVVDESSEFRDVQKGDSLVTLPARPYLSKLLAGQLQQRWNFAADKFFRQQKAVFVPVDIPERGRDTIIFSCSLHSTSRIFQILQRQYSRQFEQLGYNYHQVSMPREREAHELSQGNIDGTCGRTEIHALNQPNAVRVKFAIVSSKIRVWSLSAVEDIRELDDLIPQRRIAYVRGTTVLEQRLAGYRGHLIPTTTMVIGMKMLAAGRVDYLVGIDNVYQSIIADTVFQAPIYAVGTLGTIEAYPYLHRRHSELAERLEGLLQQRSTDE